MSLDKKKIETTKRLSFVGTQEDFESLADVLAQTKRMFNIDIEKKKKGVPMRISISESVEPEAVTYPRVARALEQLSEALHKEIPASDDTQTIGIPIGSMDWIYNDPRSHGYAPGRNTPVSVKVLQSITDGRAISGLKSITAAKHYANRNIVDVFDAMLIGDMPDNMRDKGGLFHTVEPEWVYIQTAEVWPTEDKVLESLKEGENIKKLRELEVKRLRDAAAYPPDLGMIENSKGKKIEPTKAIVAVFRGDVEFDMNQKLNIDMKRWGNFVKSLPDDLLSKELTKNKPKTVEDFMKVFLAYNVASFMKMENATVRPIAPNRTSISTEHIFGAEKEAVPPFAPPKKMGDKILYSALVVGSGKIRIGHHDIENMPEDKIPGWN